MPSKFCELRSASGILRNAIRNQQPRHRVMILPSIPRFALRRYSAVSIGLHKQLETNTHDKHHPTTGNGSSGMSKYRAELSPLKDPYHSRVASRSSWRVRPDPIIWGDALGALRAQELDSYSKNGYLEIKDLLNDSEINGLQDELSLMLIDLSFRLDPRCVIELSSEEVRSVFEIHKLSATVKSLLQSNKLTSIARQILGSDVYIHQSRINFKPPFAGKGFYWHSDFETWHAEDGMPAPRALSFSINLTENSYANGPLMIIPGSHKTFVSCIGETPENHHLQSLREQEIGVPDQESLALLAAQGGTIKVFTSPPGSAVVFDSNCMHGSSDNITPFGRCNLFIVFNSVENTLREPYYSKAQRPEYIAAREFTQV